MAYFQLGQVRSHQAVADQIGEKLPTIKNWASRHSWTARLQDFNSGLMQDSVRDHAARFRRNSVEWDEHLRQFREQEWEAARKLNDAVRCFLESFGDEDLRKMNLAQVARALKISSQVARLSLAEFDRPAPSIPEMSPLQQQLLAAVKCLYGKDSSSSSPQTLLSTVAAPSAQPKPDTTTN
jgi:uncharacterized protein YjcR